MSSPTNQKLDRELNLKAIILFAAALVGVLLAMAWLMWALSGTLKERLISQDPPLPRLPAARTQAMPPTPRLQTEPEDELKLMRAEEELLLSTYAWVDQASGVARVPIATAIDLLASEQLAKEPVNGSSAETR